MILNRDFYLQKPMDAVHQLLGAYLCRRMDDGTVIRARIAEVELYHQCERACHAYDGRRTVRNDAMFMAGGHAYVYLCYGMHNMLNIVLGPADMAVAALVRAVEIPGGNGPGKLCCALGITRAENKLDLTRGEKLWIEPRIIIPKIATGVRIGVDYAGTDAALSWRFAIADSPFISRPI